jgi:AcrR family transcriptional regulator
MATRTSALPTRERIVDAARELFWLQGYEATSVAEILEKAGVNPGSLYHHFRSKEEVLLAVLDGYKELLYPMIIAPAFERVADPLKRIFAILEGYRRGLELTVYTGGCPIGNLALEVGDRDSEARQRIAENFRGWCGWIERCLVEAGDRLPASVNRAALAQFVLTVMEGAVMQARAHASIAPFDASVAHLWDYFNRLQDEAAPERVR